MRGDRGGPYPGWYASLRREMGCNVDYIFDHNLGFLFVDMVILLGVARDLLVDGRIHRVYLVSLPLIMVFEACLIYLWRGAPAWWLRAGQLILG